MTIVSFIVLLVIAAIAGSVGQFLAGYSRGGCLMSIVVGFVGAYLGLWLAGQFGLPNFIPSLSVARHFQSSGQSLALLSWPYCWAY